jgi:hypothetical protein
MLSKFSKAIYVYLKYEDDHVFINLDRAESWLVANMDLDIVTHLCRSRTDHCRAVCDREL